MASKTSKEALLESCTPIDEVRKSMPEYFQKLEELSEKRKADLESLRQNLVTRNVPQSESELEEKQAELKNKQEQERLVLEEEISASEREFSSHGRIYKWLHEGGHESEIRHKRYSLESRFINMHRELFFSLTQWQSLVEALSPPEDDVFYCLNNRTRDFYVHNPPESWRLWKEVYGYCPTFPSWLISKGSSEQIFPVDRLEDINCPSPQRGKLVFLHGFTVKDIKVLHKPESSSDIHDAEGSDYDVNYHYLLYTPPRNDLLITLEKIDQIPCFVQDNNESTRDEEIDKRKWKIDPAKWQKFIGKRVEICAESGIRRIELSRMTRDAGNNSYSYGSIYSDPYTMIRILD